MLRAGVIGALELARRGAAIVTTAESGVAGETLEGLIEPVADVVAGSLGGPQRR